MGMTAMCLLAKVTLFVLVARYLAVKVVDPAFRPVTRYVALAWIAPVLLLVPCARMTAVVSEAATVELPETSKLM